MFGQKVLKFIFLNHDSFVGVHIKFTSFDRMSIKEFFVRGSSVYLQRFLSFDIFFSNIHDFWPGIPTIFFSQILLFSKSPRFFFSQNNYDFSAKKMSLKIVKFGQENWLRDPFFNISTIFGQEELCFSKFYYCWPGGPYNFFIIFFF